MLARAAPPAMPPIRGQAPPQSGTAQASSVSRGAPGGKALRRVANEPLPTSAQKGGQAPPSSATAKARSVSRGAPTGKVLRRSAKQLPLVSDESRTSHATSHARVTQRVTLPRYAHSSTTSS